MSGPPALLLPAALVAALISTTIPQVVLVVFLCLGLAGWFAWKGRRRRDRT